VQKTYSHMMPDGRDRARKAKAEFFRRAAAEEERKKSGEMDVR
jgi:hypothetical protein